MAESLEAARDGRQNQYPPARDASPVLQNRRERLEELTLEAQEMRARRELVKLRRDEQEEGERRQAEVQVREDEAAQHQAELQLERERLKHEQVQERMQLEREREQERQRVQVEQQLAAFRCQWLGKASEAVSAYNYRWLSAAQRKEILEALETEIRKRHPSEESGMSAIITRSLEVLAEPFRAERDTQERRQRLTEKSLRTLPYSATETERVRATAAIREALRSLDAAVDECEMRVAAEEAIRPIRGVVERRALEGRLVSWAVRELPWSKTEADEAQLRRDCTEILAELPDDVSEWEARKELEPTVREACQEIKSREAEGDRRAHKANFVRQGIAEVTSYLLELHNLREISDDDYWDSGFRADLREAVRSELESELSGHEAARQVTELARAIVNDHLDE